MRFPVLRLTKIRFMIGVIAVCVLVFGVFITLHFVSKSKNPLPPVIKQAVHFSTIYPSSVHSTIDQNSYSYQSTTNTLTYSVTSQNTRIIMTEQTAPNGSTTPTLASYEALGLHPVAQIQTKLGLAVLVNFYTVGNFGSVGPDALLIDHGTLLIARPTTSLQPEAWKNFLNTLVVSK